MPVRLNWKVLGLVLGAALLMLGSGCSGINASQGISPASFFLPGLLKADPPQAQPDHAPPGVEPAKELARL